MKAVAILVVAAAAFGQNSLPWERSKTVAEAIPLSWIEGASIGLSDAGVTALMSRHAAYAESYGAVADPGREALLEGWGNGDTTGRFGQFAMMEDLLEGRARLMRELAGIDEAFFADVEGACAGWMIDLLRARRSMVVQVLDPGENVEASLDVIELVSWEDLGERDVARYFSAYASRMAEAGRAELDDVGDMVEALADEVARLSEEAPDDAAFRLAARDRLMPVATVYMERYAASAARMVAINRQAVARAKDVLGAERGQALQRAYWCAAFGEWYPCDDAMERALEAAGAAEALGAYVEARDELCQKAIEREMAYRDEFLTDLEMFVPEEAREAREARLKAFREDLEELRAGALRGGGIQVPYGHR